MGRVERQPQPLFAQAQNLGLAAHFELRDDLTAERRQALRLRGRQRAHDAVRHREAADHMPPGYEERRGRILRLLGVLDSQPFDALPDADAARAARDATYGYLFDSCAAALAEIGVPSFACTPGGPTTRRLFGRTR